MQILLTWLFNFELRDFLNSSYLTKYGAKFFIKCFLEKKSYNKNISLL